VKKKSLKKVQVSMQDIWNASKPNVEKSKKAYSRKGKSKPNFDEDDNFYPDSKI
jgi:hypothetical protein|tara:strand:+ start:66 stop:227 length:162 start_codon:yes stop_codon:yes gene_type:complete